MGSAEWVGSAPWVSHAEEGLRGHSGAIKDPSRRSETLETLEAFCSKKYDFEEGWVSFQPPIYLKYLLNCFLRC